MIDSTGKIIIEPKYSSIDPFKNGRYLLRENTNQYGMRQCLVDEDGNELLPCEYFSIYDIAEDTIIVRKNGLLGILNSNMEWILPLNYKYLIKEKNFFKVALEKGFMGVLDSNLNQSVPLEYSSIYHPHVLNDFHFIVTKNSKQGLIDINNSIIIPIEFEALAIIVKFNYYIGIKNNQTTIFDLEGNIVFSKQTKDLIILTENRFGVVNQNKKWGVFDTMGKQIINYQFNKIIPANDNLYIAQNSEFKWGAINDENKIIIPFEYMEPFIFKEGKAFVKNKSGKYGFINLSGQKITEFIYDDAECFNAGYAKVKVNKQSGLIDSNGFEVLEPIYNFISGPFNNLFIMRRANEYFFMPFDQLMNGSRMAYEYININDLIQNRELILVKKNGLYGFIDKYENVIIPIIYENAREFNDNHASVLLDNETFVIDKTGKKIALRIE